MHLLIINIIAHILFSIFFMPRRLRSISRLPLPHLYGPFGLTINLNSSAASKIDHRYIVYIFNEEHFSVIKTQGETD